ncbi:MAG TPA: Uma2 family endonuclease [Candidatus Limnocylindrales bacterium]|nr:Uma2 family endonuclease [Candidatus Limnocylindrales bacterium]
MVTLKRKLDYEDYAGIPTDRNRHEIIDGNLFVTPAPSPLHQRVSRRLQRILEDYFHPREVGEVFNAPIDVILSPHDVLQPDLVLARAPQVSARGIEGPPVLVIEILSPSTMRQDRNAKARRYAELGVGHYWIVDPEARRIECYRLVGSEYAMLIVADDDSVLAHPDWPDLSIPGANLWR